MITYEQRLHRSPQAIFEEASLYFMQQGDLYQALHNLIERLNAAEIPYALNRRRDLADVQDLIGALELEQALADQLDPSVRDLYLQLWQELQAVNNEER